MSRYDLLVLGDKAEPGGDCTHYGCVPSKTLLDVAHRVAGAREAQQWGLGSVGDVDSTAVMRHVHDVIDRISADESPAQLEAEGIDHVRGWARLTAPDTLDVDGQVLRGSQMVLATGAHASIPPIDGLDAVPYLDNKSLFDLTEKPEHLLVMGGGAIGVELAQAFSQLGSRVTLVEAADRILTKEEPEAAAVLTTVLERSGVELGKQGQVVTDAYLRTSVEGVFAAGDCTTPLQFTHVGDEQGRLAAANAFARGSVLPAALGGMSAFDDSVVPWVTFTDPEVGRVGMTEQQAYDAYGERARVVVVRRDEMDRTRTSAHTDGYLKLIAGPRPVARHQLLDRVIGVTAVMPAGGEIAAMGALAMHTNMLVGRIAQVTAPYPTHALGLRVAAARLFGEFAGASWRPARGGAG